MALACQFTAVRQAAIDHENAAGRLQAVIPACLTRYSGEIRLIPGLFSRTRSVTGLSTTQLTASPLLDDGLRPVNLRTDLRPLADLIELVFADSMDSSGRSAIREMRYLSHIGYGLHLASRLNELMLGISMGFVYVADGQLVGNVSVYPSGYPKDMRAAWILANIGVHPAYQRRGIAGDLVNAAVGMIAKRRGQQVILQVNRDNHAALRLYERQGFSYERTWRNWRRSGFIKGPLAEDSGFQIAGLRPHEWKAGVCAGAGGPSQCARRTGLVEASAPIVFPDPALETPVESLVSKSY